MQNRFISDIKDNQYIKKVAFLRTTRNIETVSLAIVNLKLKKKKKTTSLRQNKCETTAGKFRKYAVFYGNIELKFDIQKFRKYAVFYDISNFNLIYRNL